MTPEISKELQATIASHPNISEVHFDESGRYYFISHKLQDKKDSKTWNLYGKGKYSHSKKIEGIFNVDNVSEQIAIGQADTLIVETLTREEILDAEAVSNEESLVSKIMKMPKSELAALKALLNEDSE